MKLMDCNHSRNSNNFFHSPHKPMPDVSAINLTRVLHRREETSIPRLVGETNAGRKTKLLITAGILPDSLTNAKGNQAPSPHSKCHQSAASCTSISPSRNPRRRNHDRSSALLMLRRNPLQRNNCATCQPSFSKPTSTGTTYQNPPMTVVSGPS